MTDTSEKLANIADALVESILGTPDDEMAADCLVAAVRKAGAANEAKWHQQGRVDGLLEAAFTVRNSPGALGLSNVEIADELEKLVPANTRPPHQGMREALEAASLHGASDRELREALEFYADPETYFAIGFFPDPPCGDFADDFSDTGFLGMRPGKRARAALASPPPSKEAAPE